MGGDKATGSEQAENISYLGKESDNDLNFSGDFPIVGIGSSAGGLSALKELVQNLRADSGMAFVIIHHMSANATSNMAEILTRETDIPVNTISNEMAIETNQIYISPPDSLAVLKNESLLLTTKSSVPGGATLQPIDNFLISLAAEKKSNCIGVILSGMGTDGVLGIKEINLHGGIVFAQSRETAEFFDMPENSILQGHVDFVSSPKNIANELCNAKNGVGLFSEGELFSHAKLDGKIHMVMDRILKRKCHDFSRYKQATINRRIVRRMALLNLKKVEDYVLYLDKKPEELEALFNDLLINVTRFFRDGMSFERLKVSVFPAIFNNSKRNSPVRVWIPGCSTGEEAYSLAIIMDEYIEENKIDVPIQIFATDVSDLVIEKSRRGIFSENIKEDVSKIRLQKYFTAVDEGYKIKKSIRDLCIFATQNIFNDPPFSLIDLVSCRNLLIYFEDDLQKRVFPILHYALKTSGYLFLGNSESIRGFDHLFSSVDSHHRIYRKVNIYRKQFFEPRSLLISQDVPRKYFPTKKTAFESGKARDVLKYADRIISANLSPVGFVVNNKLDILEIRGDTTPYIGPSPGAPSYSITKFLREELRAPVLSLINKVSKSEMQKVQSIVPLSYEGGIKTVRIQVFSMEVPQGNVPHFVILLNHEDEELTKGGARNSKIHLEKLSDVDDFQGQNLLKTLHMELNDTKRQLKSLVEDFELTSEDLETKNEEILSSNEELQSTNEELQTAKEEIQSSNEELTTTNEELQNRIEDLAQSNDDLDNLLKSMRIPLVMLDRKKNIRKFSPSGIKLFNLIPTDIGRPISDINTTFNSKQIITMIDEVLDNNQPQFKDIQSNEGMWFSMQIRPYISNNNKTDGVVLSFVDVHAMKTMVSEEIMLFAEDIVQTVKYPIVVLNGQQQIQTVNDAFYDYFKLESSEILGQNLGNLMPVKWKSPELTQLLNDVIFNKRSFENYEVDMDLGKLGKKSFLISGREIFHENVGTKLVVLTLFDNTKKKEEERLHQQIKKSAEDASLAKTKFLANMSHEIRTPLSSIIGFSKILTNSNLSEEKRYRFVESINKNSQHLLDLLNDILDLSKIEAEQVHIDMSQVSLIAEIESVVQALSANSLLKGIEVTTDYSNSVPSLGFTDSTKFRQIIYNVVGNAIKFTDSGEVQIDVDATPLKEDPEKSQEFQKMKIILTVRDTGCGVSKDDVKRLFEPFSRASTSKDQRYSGTGLGLVLSKKMANLLGGDLTLKETEVGKGSTFEISITCAVPCKAISEPEHSVPKKNAEQLENKPLNGIKVLLVEDNIDVQILYKYILNESGAEVIVASDGEVAIEKVMTENPRVILMDIQLPKLDGCQVTRRIREKNINTPIIAISANALASEKKRCLSYGFNAYWSKPVSPQQLLSEVKKWAQLNPIAKS